MKITELRVGDRVMKRGEPKILTITGFTKKDGEHVALLSDDTWEYINHLFFERRFNE